MNQETARVLAELKAKVEGLERRSQMEQFESGVNTDYWIPRDSVLKLIAEQESKLVIEKA